MWIGTAALGKDTTVPNVAQLEGSLSYYWPLFQIPFQVSWYHSFPNYNLFLYCLIMDLFFSLLQLSVTWQLLTP